MRRSADHITRSPTRGTVRAAALMAMALAVLAIWPAIFFAKDWGRAATDDLAYHSFAIRRFVVQFPSVSFKDYESATTPGYHLVLAAVQMAGGGRLTQRLIASAYTIVLIGLLARLSAERFGLRAVAFVIPFLVSIYFIYSGIWLLPDNSGWLGVLGMILLALRPRQTLGTLLASGGLLALLVFFRQSHIWTASLVWISAWVGADDQVPGLKRVFSDSSSRLRRLAPAVLATVPGFLTMAYFVVIWHGLVPPMFQTRHQGPNPATPAFILTQIGIFSVFFLPVLITPLRRVWNNRRAAIPLALILGAVMGFLPHTTENNDAGRYSGFWHFAALLPTIGERSLFIAVGSVLGSFMLVGWVGMLNLRDRWILCTGFAAFAAAMTTNFASWQRYHEPMLLMFGLLILTRSELPDRKPAWAIRGSLGLSLMLAVVLVKSVRDMKPVSPALLQAQYERQF